VLLERGDDLRVGEALLCDAREGRGLRAVRLLPAVGCKHKLTIAFAAPGAGTLTLTLSTNGKRSVVVAIGT
jgi:hypothetical protein